MHLRPDPGECIVCGAAHCACRDHAAADPPTAPVVDATPPLRLVADIVQDTLPPGGFTSGTYRRPGRRR